MGIWDCSMNFKFIKSLDTVEDLLNCDDSTVILDYDQNFILSMIFGLDNTKELERELGIFSHKTNDNSPNLELMHTLIKFFGFFPSIKAHRHGGHERVEQ